MTTSNFSLGMCCFIFCVKLTRLPKLCPISCAVVISCTMLGIVCPKFNPETNPLKYFRVRIMLNNTRRANGVVVGRIADAASRAWASDPSEADDAVLKLSIGKHMSDAIWTPDASIGERLQKSTCRVGAARNRIGRLRGRVNNNFVDQESITRHALKVRILEYSIDIDNAVDHG